MSSFLIRNSVEPHESHFFFYFRKNVFQFEEYNSCGQEGSHYAIKWSAGNILPNMKLSTSAKQVIKQSERKCAYTLASHINNCDKTIVHNELNCSKN